MTTSLRIKKKLSKKGVSIMIGYVLLVAFAVVMGGIVYAWIKTYVPSNSLSCPEGVSLYIENVAFSNSQLNVTLNNNGKFNIGGYFIDSKSSSSQQIATEDLSPYLNLNYGGTKLGNSIVFSVNKTGTNLNTFAPGQQASNIFNLPKNVSKPYSITVTPIVFQIQNNVERLASCTNAMTEQIVS